MLLGNAEMEIKIDSLTGETGNRPARLLSAGVTDITIPRPSMLCRRIIKSRAAPDKLDALKS
jgi:hypothetical protein